MAPRLIPGNAISPQAAPPPRAVRATPEQQILHLRNLVQELHRQLEHVKAQLAQERKRNLVILTQDPSGEPDTEQFPPWGKAFLEMFRDTCNDRLSIEAANAVMPADAPPITRDMVDRYIRGCYSFRLAYNEAHADGVDALHNELRLKAIQTRSTADIKWLLEREDRERFGPVQRQEISGPRGGPVEQKIVNIDYRAELVSLLRKVVDDPAEDGVPILPDAVAGEDAPVRLAGLLGAPEPAGPAR